MKKITAIFILSIPTAILILGGIYLVYQKQDESELSCRLLLGSFHGVEDRDIGFLIDDPRICKQYAPEGVLSSIGYCTTCMGSILPSEKRRAYDSTRKE